MAISLWHVIFIGMKELLVIVADHQVLSWLDKFVHTVSSKKVTICDISNENNSLIFTHTQEAIEMSLMQPVYLFRDAPCINQRLKHGNVFI